MCDKKKRRERVAVTMNDQTFERRK